MTAAPSQTPTARFVSAFIVVTLITAGATHARALFVSAVVALVIGGGAYDASAQSMFDPRSEFGPFVHQATLTTSGLTSIAGDTALVAAGGVVVAWERDPETDAWAEGARLAPSDSAANFGRALAFDGATAIVGAEDAAYLFVRETGAWRELAKLIPRDGLSGFGAAVDIDGSHAIVGGSGAYIFMFDPAGGETWKEVVKLELPGPLASGRPVGLSGETAIVGSHTTPEHSAAYIFGRHQGGHDKWGLVKRLPEEGTGFHFLFGVAVDGDTAMVGGGEVMGYAYVFARNHGGPNAWRLEAEYGTGEDRIGEVRSVEISSEKAILRIVDFEVVVLARNQGRSHAWGRVSRFIFPIGGPLAVRSVSLDGDTALIALSSPGIGLVMASDVDRDGLRDGIDACPRDPLNNVEGGCTRTSAAYLALDDLITLGDVATETRGDEFHITATFTNTSETAIGNPFFEVTDLTGGNLLVNADAGPGGPGATLSPDVGDGVLSPGESTTVTFVVGLATHEAFSFYVSVRGDAGP